MTDKPMPGAIRLDRRHFLGGSAGPSASTSFLGLPRAAPAEGPLQEAPQLTELVKQGKLPPARRAAARRPPSVVTPVEGAGTYGGTWTMGTTGAGDSAWWWRTSGYGGLTRIDVDTGKAVPNVAESFERERGRHQLPLQAPRGPEVVRRRADDVGGHRVLVGGLHPQSASSGPPARPPSCAPTSGPGTITADGDYAVVFTFKEANGFLPNWLATNLGNPSRAMPKHYLGQFHAGHNPDAEALARKEGFNSWPDLFLNKAGAATLHQAGGLPVVRPWVMETVLGTGSRLVFERNPYFYKVDTNGSQLPYLDRVVFEIIEDPQVMLLKASNGEINYQLRHFNTPENKPILARKPSREGLHAVEPRSPST